MCKRVYCVCGGGGGIINATGANDSRLKGEMKKNEVT